MNKLFFIIPLIFISCLIFLEKEKTETLMSFASLISTTWIAYQQFRISEKTNKANIYEKRIETLYFMQKLVMAAHNARSITDEQKEELQRNATIQETHSLIFFDGEKDAKLAIKQIIESTFFILNYNDSVSTSGMDAKTITDMHEKRQEKLKSLEDHIATIADATRKYLK